MISKMKDDREARASYIRSKINVLVPAQLHALRLKRGWTQNRMAQETAMKQSRVSAMECPGAVNFNMDTLVRAAAALGVGLAVKFVPFSEMLSWENQFNQDEFDVVHIDKDFAFRQRVVRPASKHARTVTVRADRSSKRNNQNRRLARG
jgi:transcriptional regulator with XRE-family HTH domain